MSARVIVLGSTGMLGQQVVKTFSKFSQPFSAFSRTGAHGGRFTFTGQSAEEVSQELSVKPGDHIINCIGWIPQVSSGDFKVDSENASLLNVTLPETLEKVSNQFGVRVLQVSTDCVFGGQTGEYSELSPKDATDLYGITKVQGEEKQPSAMRIRASIIGPDANSSSGLFSWFLSQSDRETVTGFTDHIWNGVSTLAMAKLFLGIVRSEAFSAGCFHWVPKGHLSKFQLLWKFSQELRSTAPEVIPGPGPVPINRSLTTISPSENLKLWHLAGYPNVPEVEAVVSEMILEFLREGEEAK